MTELVFCLFFVCLHNYTRAYKLDNLTFYDMLLQLSQLSQKSSTFVSDCRSNVSEPVS